MLSLHALCKSGRDGGSDSGRTRSNEDSLSMESRRVALASLDIRTDEFTGSFVRETSLRDLISSTRERSVEDGTEWK